APRGILTKKFTTMAHNREYNEAAPITINNKNTFIECLPDKPCAAGWMFKDGATFVSGKWLKRNTMIDCDIVSDEEYYQTMLTYIGISNVEWGSYGLKIESTIYPGQPKQNIHEIVGGKSYSTFLVLIGNNWMKVTPRDHRGFYQQASE